MKIIINEIFIKMSNFFYILLLFLCILMDYVNTQNIPVSPCPDIFAYRYDGSDWGGFLQVPSPPLGQTLNIKVHLSLRAQLPSQDIGALELATTRNVALQQIVNGQPTQYRIRFPIPSPLPKVTSIIYNSRVICSGQQEQGPVVTSIRLEHVLYTELAKNNISNKDKNDLDYFPNYTEDKYNNPFYYYQDLNTNFNHFSNNNQPVRLEPQQPAIIQNPDSFFSRPTNSQPPQRPPSMLLPTIRPTQNQQQQPKPQPQPQQQQHHQQTQVRPQQQQQTHQQQPIQQQQPTHQQQPNQQQQNSQVDAIASSIFSTLSDNDICGMPDSRYNIAPLVVGGQAISRGAWPWLTAVYVSDDSSSLSFKCGGNLVSNKVVITAAHCVTSTKKVYQAHEVLVYLGRYNIRRWEKEEGSEIRESAVLVTHPDYMKGSSGSFDADIAVIVLKTSVQYNQFIRPICLWNGPSDIRVVEGKMGTVVGWGRDENGQIVTPEPRKTQIPVVQESMCLRSGETFRQITSNRTFCAGNRDGTGPCNGDSGSGMAMRWNDRWTLRGLVSVAALDPVNNVCNLKEFVVFTDAAKFVDWIKSFTTL